jgi:cation:H+ antiporter
MVVLEFLGAFVLIVAGAIGFTNAVEWLGKRLDLGAGAVGAILAAVGTALPESLIPVVALISGGGDAESVEIAIGAIIGAPFLLGTAAMLLISGAALAFRGRREHGEHVQADPAETRRDLGLFLVAMPFAVLLGVLDTSPAVQIAGAVLLVLAYAAYTARTISVAKGEAEDEDLEDLYMDPSKEDPPSTAQITVQFIASLAAIIVGAELFVRGVESLAESLGIAPLIIALVLAPLATELPEKANSVLWIRDDKDVLATGNVTGAMAFQSTIPVAMGLVLTTWHLNGAAAAAAVAGILGGALARYVLPRQRLGLVPSLGWAVLLIGSLAVIVTV